MSQCINSLKLHSYINIFFNKYLNTNNKIFLFGALYTIKQTSYGSDLINYPLIFLYILIVVATLKDFISFYKEHINFSVLFIWSFLSASILFNEPEDALRSLLKIIFLFSLFLIDKKKFIAMKMISLGITFALFLILSLNYLKIIDGTIFNNTNWVKNSMGFYNPNIGPFFLLSIAFSGIFIKKNLLPLILFLAIIFFIFFDFYSRTEILVISLISFLYFSGKSKIIILIFARLSILIMLLYSIYFYMVYFGFFTEKFELFGVLNYISSNRLDLIYKLPFIVSSSGPIFFAGRSDGTLYEFLLVMGPIFFIFFIYKLISLSTKYQNNSILIAFIACICIGFFEGIFNKISPIGIGLLHIINSSNNIPYQKFSFIVNLNKLKIISIKIMAVIGLLLLLLAYKTPVIEVIIKPSINLGLANLISATQANPLCDKLKVNLRLQNSTNIILVTANNYSSANACVDGIKQLLLNDYDDNKRLYPKPEFFVSEIEAEKKNIIRYIFMFLLLTVVIIIPIKIGHLDKSI